MRSPAVLAEAIQFSNAEILLIIVALLAMLLVAGGIVVLGCLFARRAGEGSQGALIGWGVIAAGEVVLVFAGLVNGEALSSFLIIGAVLGLQVALYFRGRKRLKE